MFVWEQEVPGKHVLGKRVEAEEEEEKAALGVRLQENQKHEFSGDKAIALTGLV